MTGEVAGGPVDADARAGRRPVTNAVDDLVGRVLAGRYRLRRVIGTGASGRVYEADDVQLGRRVAVKVLHRALADDQGFLQRFRAEARVAAALAHRNIVTVHDWGEDDTAFMVTELLEGGSLRAMLDAEARLTPAQAARLGRDVAGALEYAHARGIVHRDIKPANLLFDEHAVVRIADFGLARALAEASWTEPAGTVFGTARYASPEQAQGVALDARSDVYSLALVLYEAITGTIPFAADTVIGSLAMRTQQPITAPAEWGPLRAVIERAGRVDPAERYPTAASMAAALRDACDVLGRPAPLPLAGLHGHAAIDPNPTAIAPAVVRHPSDPFPAEARPVADVRTEPVGRVIDLRDPVENAAPEGDVAGRATPVLFDQDADAIAAGRDDGRDDDPVVLFDQDAAAPTEVTPVVAIAERDPARRARRAGRFVPVVIAIAIAAIVGIGVYALAAGGGGALHTIPNAVGLDRAAAEALAADADVDVRVREIEADDPEGIVIEQQPAAGSRSSSALTIVVSTGPPPVEAPRLVGLARADAELAAVDAGLVPRVEAAFDEEVPKGRVVRQRPAVGAAAERDSTITITVSQGPAPREIPTVAGDEPDAAQAALEGLGFTVVRVREFSDDVEEGRVVGTRPAVGEEAPFGSEVTLVVSKGPELVPVPNVFGQGWQSACREIRGAGFECDVENFSENGTVQNQDPQPGERLRRGSSVTIYL